jgi:Cys-tRNA(Pro) deacylase
MINSTLSTKMVQEAAQRKGFPIIIKNLPTPARTSLEAAKVIGCDLAQIAKSLVFKTKNSQKPVLIIASGANRVNEEKISNLIGEEIIKAEANFVFQQTGFIVGGIPPFGHKQAIRTFIDQDLLSYDEIWASAGTPQANFKISPDRLIKITKGRVTPIT